MHKPNSIIDCDPGIDDALAILFAVKSGQLDVRHILTVGGNVGAEQAARNAKYVTSLLKASDIKISRGFDAQADESSSAVNIHGPDGLAGLNLVAVNSEKASNLQMRIEDVLEPFNNNNLTVIATGPLTNIAWILQNDAEATKKISRLVIMGGAVNVRGNVSEFAEFNIYHDPQAASIVLQSSLNITLVPLDVTHQCILTPTDLDIIIDTKIGTFVKKLVRFYYRSYIDRRGFIGCPLHDPLAVGVAIDSSFVDTEKMGIRIEVSGTKRGMSCLSNTIGEMDINVCTGVRSKEFIKYFIEVMNKNL
jgi:purine nucleosidase